MMDVSTTEMEAFDSKPVILGCFVLFDIAARFERGEQAKDVVLVQLEPLGKFGNAKFIDFAEKLLQHVERMRNRLNNVISFIASNHGVLFWYPAFATASRKRTLEKCFNLNGKPKQCQRRIKRYLRIG
jgi:hypothetical protein